MSPTPFPGTHPDAPKAAQLSPHAQALLDKQRHQNRDSLFVQSLAPTGQMTASSTAFSLDRSDPYLPVIDQSEPSETLKEKRLQSFRDAVKMGDLNAAYGTGDSTMHEARLELSKKYNQIIHDIHKMDAVATPLSTCNRIRYQKATDGDLDSPKKFSTDFESVFRRRVGSSANHGTVSPTAFSHDHEDEPDPSFIQETKRRLRPVRIAVGAAPVPAGFDADDAKPSYCYGPTFGTRLVRRSMKVEQQSWPREEYSKPCSSVGYISSTLLSRDSLNVEEALRFLDTEYGVTFSAESNTVRRPMKFEQQPWPCEEYSKPCSSVGYIGSTLLSRDPLNVQEALRFLGDDYDVTFSAGSSTSPLETHGNPDLNDDGSELSSSAGSATSTLLSCSALSAGSNTSSSKAHGQPDLNDAGSEPSSSAGSTTSTLLSCSALSAGSNTSSPKAHGNPDLDDDGSEPSSSSGSATSTLLSSSALSVAEQPALSNDSLSPSPSVETDASLPNANDDPPAPLPSASSFLVSTLTPAAFLPPIYPTDTILWVKIGSRILSRVIPLNMSSEARARCDSGKPFIEGLLTSTAELKPRCLKGLTQIEGVLMDEVAKILTAESLADLKRYDHGTESRAELGTGNDEKLKAVHGSANDKDAGAFDKKGESSVMESSSVRGVSAQARDALLEHINATMRAIKIENRVKLVQGSAYIALHHPIPASAMADAEMAAPNEKQHGDQEWEMVDAEMEDGEMGKAGSVVVQGYAEAWTLL